MQHKAAPLSDKPSTDKQKLGCDEHKPPPKKKRTRFVGQNLTVSKPEAKARTSNGSQLLPNGDLRSRAARRFRDILINIVTDRGGPDRLSECEMQLARRAALLAQQCEEYETAALARGETIDLDAYGRLTGHLRRAMESLGLSRVSHDTTPNLADIVARLNGGES